MKYFLDTEFLEGKQTKSFMGVKYGETAPTIDLISIGIVDSLGREYYAVSNEFNLKEAWNRFDINERSKTKNYWIRENVLLPIYNELLKKERYASQNFPGVVKPFSYKSLKTLIDWNGKSNKKIAEEIFDFVNPDLGFPCESYNNSSFRDKDSVMSKHFDKHNVTDIGGNFVSQPEFYGYYCDFDWVVFCWLFGKMINLPSGFPMYCIDLKQVLDKKVDQKDWYYGRDIWSNTRQEGDMELQKGDYPASFKDKLKKMKSHDEYPKQKNEHNALADAWWNYELYNFLNNVK